MAWLSCDLPRLVASWLQGYAYAKCFWPLARQSASEESLNIQLLHPTNGSCHDQTNKCPTSFPDVGVLQIVTNQALLIEGQKWAKLW